MEKIKSFTINHETLEPGIYLSRVDGDINTYDIRLLKPNYETYLYTGSLHTIEHLFATYARNSKWKEHVLYFGPMGCRTGFYLLTRNKLGHLDAITLVQDSFAYIAEYTGEIPGARKEECGNYLDHDLSQAKTDAERYLKYIKNYSLDKLNYPN